MFCQCHKIILMPRHVPDRLNVHVDFPSKTGQSHHYRMVPQSSDLQGNRFSNILPTDRHVCDETQHSASNVRVYLSRSPNLGSGCSGFSLDYVQQDLLFPSNSPSDKGVITDRDLSGSGDPHSSKMGDPGVVSVSSSSLCAKPHSSSAPVRSVDSGIAQTSLSTPVSFSRMDCVRSALSQSGFF